MPGKRVPEGPEIRRAADRVARVLVGEQLDEVSFAFPSLQPYEDQLASSSVRAVDTHGKAMLTRFENDLTIYSHNQLYGRWFTVKRGQLPDTRRSLRLALHTSTHSALLYSASDITVLTPETLATHPFLSRLGPDILDDKLDSSAIEKRLDMDRFRRRSLAALYLDQTFLAGLGNYLRSEILFCSGLHPKSRPMDLDTESKSRLATETLKICNRTYQTGGITLARPDRRGKGERFYVFARASRRCYACKTPVVRNNFSGRRLYYCPDCQQERTK